MTKRTRTAYDATVPIGRQAKYLAALRAQFGKSAKITVRAIEGRSLVRPHHGRKHAAPTLTRIVVAVPDE